MFRYFGAAKLMLSTAAGLAMPLAFALGSALDGRSGGDAASPPPRPTSEQLAPANAANQAPVANAGVNRSVTLPANQLVLSGTGTDADGTVVAYHWRQISGPKIAAFSSFDVAAPTISSLVVGSYVFSLVVTDDQGATSVASQATITVFPANQIPVANAGGAQTIVLPATSVKLSGTGTDADGTVVAYRWQQVSGPGTARFSSATVAAPTVTSLVAGSYVFSLVVTDDQGANGVASQVTVKVVPANQAPVANAGSAQLLVLPTASTQLAGTGSAAPGHTLAAYRWRQLSGPAPAPAQFSDSTLAAPTVSALVAGSYVFALTVTDEQGAASVPSRVTITVNPATTGAVAYRLNVGGPATPTSRGAFTADAFFAPAPGTTYAAGNASVAATLDPVLYRTERAGTRFSYALPVSNGTYALVLHFAEFYWTQPGQRVFDVAVEGRKVLTQYDIVKKVGPYAATTETLQVTVTDGVLNLDFSALFSEGGRDQAKLSALEVLAPVSATSPPTAYAGLSQTLTLPTASTQLAGTGSAAPGHTLAAYRWRQLSGPAPAQFSDSTLAAPTVSALVAGSYVFALTVTDEQGAASVPSRVTITVNPATTGAVAYRLNVGGPATPTSRGAFTADAFFAPAPGTTYAAGNASVAATLDPVLYRTERAGTRFSYALPVSNGTYALVLHFAEFYWTQPGQRVFDVAVEGRKVLTQYDIVKKVGPYAATTETLQVTVTDGVLNLDFSALFSEGGRDQAKVSAIEVLAPVSAASPPTAYAGLSQTLTLPTASTQLAGTGSAAPGHTLAAYRWRQLSGPAPAQFSDSTLAAPTVSALVAGSYVFVLTVTDEQGTASPASQVTITVNPATTGAVAYRLNVGGGAVTTSQGDFAADAFFTPTPGTTYSSTASVSGAAAPVLYRTERAGGRFSYALPVSNGTYALVLHFAEFYWTQPGQRVFDVAVEGRKVLTQYDIVKKVGPYAATTETLQVTVTDGVLNLDFSALPAEGGRDQAKLSALEVLAPVSAASPPTAYAGLSQTLTLPTASTQLAGTGSAAPGHTLAAYRWRQLSGPAPAQFSDSTLAAPTVSALVAGSYVFGLIVTDEQGNNSYNPALTGAPAQGSGTVPSQVTITVNPATTGAVAYRLNVGGPATPTSRGAFTADAFFAPAPGTTYAAGNASVAATLDPVLYRTERAGTRFSYALPVSNGTYALVLHFAEFYWTQPGQRVFDVAVEGRKVLTQYDIVKKVGPYAATTETLQVTVTDGVLNLDFSALFSEGGRDQAKVSAIEVLAPVSAKCPDAPIVSTPLAYCVGTQAGLLSSSVTLTDGATLRMYASDTTKTQLAASFRPSTTAVATTNYYVTQVLNGCESARTPITVAVGSLTPPVLIPPAGLDQDHIAAWGDSFTDAGYGQYPRMLSQLTGLSVFNGGIGGETSAQTKTRMTADAQKRNWPCVIWSGRNDSNNQPQVLASVASMVASLGHSNYLVIPIFNGQNEGTGSYAYSQIGPLNSALAKTYGNHYLDVRSYMVSKYDSTKAQDVIDHAANTTPASLRSDFLHPNITGSNLIASYIYAHLDKLFSVDYYQGGPSQPLKASFKVVAGGILRLYASATSPTALPDGYNPPTTQVGSFTYYASQVVNGCESGRTPVTVNVISGSANGLAAAAMSSNSTTADEFTDDAGADLRQKNLFAVYPNPAADVATVELRLKKDQQYTLELYDMKGARIKQIASGRATAATRYSFQLKNETIPNGIYYIRLLSEKSSQTLKLVVNR